MHFDNFPATDRSLKHRCPSSGQSTITMASAMFSADQYNGAQIVVSVPSPGAGSDTYRVGTVIDTTTSTLVISDNATLNESIAKALYSSSTVIDDFVLLDFNDSTQANAPSGYTLGGTWSSVSHSGGTTTLTRSSGNFQSWLLGCLVVPNVNFPAYFEITGTTSTTLTVTGDLTTIAASGDYFRVHIPVGSDKSTGTLASYDPIGETWTWDAANAGSRRLWASYLYMPPRMGFTDENGFTVGTQGGTNKLGQYHCNHRRYDIRSGRWISPDQASTPWFDLFDYCGGRQLKITDPNGLKIAVDTASTEKDFIIRLMKRLCPDAELSWKRGPALVGGTDTDELVANPPGFCGPKAACMVGQTRTYGCQIICELINSNNVYWLWPSDSQDGAFNPDQWGKGSPGIHQIKFNKQEKQPHTLDFHGPNGATVKWSIARQLAHELSHAWQYEKGIHFMSPEKRACAVKDSGGDEVVCSPKTGPGDMRVQIGLRA
jgi:RHS repeat-associated protein